jgi:hypothetical protein
VRSIGMDVHRDFCEVALVEDGALRSVGRIEASPEALGAFADSLCETDEVVLETTSGAIETARLLAPRVAGGARERRRCARDRSCAGKVGPLRRRHAGSLDVNGWPASS